ncbi:MAG TPA: tetratricopeptide repeat protein [Blastocatellia bacterium]|nr:tetratricopeptide repeat protein [Blastocatellia bacterium]
MAASSIKARFLSLAIAAVLLAAAADARAQSPNSQKAKRAKSQSPSKAQTSALANAEFDKAVKLGDEARLASRLDEAIEHYAKALRIRPKWPEGWWYVGAIFYEKDLYTQARDAFRNLVALEPNRGQAWGMLGLCEFQTGEYERSVVSLVRGRALGLGDNKEIESVVRYHTALLYIRFGQFEVAYDILSEFMRVGNESPKIIEAFGLTMLRMPFLPKEIPSDRREQVLIAGRAGFNMAARRMDDARAAFDTLLARYSNEPNVHYAFGVYLLNQDADAAMKEFRRELEISPSHYPAMVQMAFEHLKRDEYDAALPLAEKAVQLAPKMFAARNVLGRVLLELGQVERAVKELEEGVKLAPTSPEMHFALARAYTRAGRKEDAAREREIFKQLQEQYEKQRGEALRGGEENQNKPKP